MDLNLFDFNRLRGNPQICWVFAPVSHTTEHAESVKILHVHFVIGKVQLDYFHSLSTVENFSRIKLFHYDADQAEAESAENRD